MAAEEKWYERLEEITWDKVQAGDILLRKTYGEDNPARKGQSLLSRGKGSPYTGHAVIYMGGNQFFEACQVDGVGFRNTTRTAWDGRWITYRPKNPAWAQSACDVARWIAGKNVGYSFLHGISTGLHDSSWGPKAAARAAMVARRELPTKAMICSESATYCYQGIKDNPVVKLDAMRTCPMRLEDYINGHPEQFTFSGKVKYNGGAPTSFSPEYMADSLKDEFAKALVEDLELDAKLTGEIIKDQVAAAAVDAKKAAEAAAAAAQKAAAAAADAAKRKAEELKREAEKKAEELKNKLKFW